MPQPRWLPLSRTPYPKVLTRSCVRHAVVPSVHVWPRWCRPSHRRRPLCVCLSPPVSPVSPPSSPLCVSVPAGVARLTAVIPSVQSRRRPLCACLSPLVSPVSPPSSPLCVSVPVGVARLTVVVPSVHVCPRWCRPSHRRRPLCACLSPPVSPVSPPSSPLCVSVPAGVARLTAVVCSVRVCPCWCCPSHRRRPLSLCACLSPLVSPVHRHHPLCACLSPPVSPVSPPSSPLCVSVPVGVARLTAVIPSVRVCPRRCRPSHRRRPLCACLSPLVSPVSPPSSPLRVSVPAGVARLTAVVPSVQSRRWSTSTSRSSRSSPPAASPPSWRVTSAASRRRSSGRSTVVRSPSTLPAAACWRRTWRISTRASSSRASPSCLSPPPTSARTSAPDRTNSTRRMAAWCWEVRGAGDGATCTAFDVINYTICDRLIYDSGRCYIVNYKRKSRNSKVEHRQYIHGIFDRLETESRSVISE